MSDLFIPARPPFIFDRDKLIDAVASVPRRFTMTRDINTGVATIEILGIFQRTDFWPELLVRVKREACENIISLTPRKPGEQGMVIREIVDGVPWHQWRGDPDGRPNTVNGDNPQEYGELRDNATALQPENAAPEEKLSP